MTPLLWISVAILAASPGDADRGAQLLDSLECNSCHRFVPRWSGASTTAVARLLKSRLTPAGFTERLWNHAPLMFGALQKEGRMFPQLTDSQAGDLLSWFFAAGYFDEPGEAGRGEHLFTKSGCHVCHLMESDQGGGMAVAKWNLAGAADLLQGVWNHWPAMNAAMGRRRLVWPSVSAGQMRDLLAFAQSRFPNANPPQMKAGSIANGRKLFEEKGCRDCHSNDTGLGQYPLYRSLTELAASFWNHVPMMTREPAPINRVEMDDILAFLWSVRYFEGSGNARRGARIFQAKRCAECHMAAARSNFANAAMIAGLWKHSPAVIEQMRQRSIKWPKFTETEMLDLIAFYAVSAK